MSARGRESAVVSLPLLLRVPVLSDQGFTFMTSFNLNRSLEAVFLIQSYERVGLQHMNWGGVCGQNSVNGPNYSLINNNQCVFELII